MTTNAALNLHPSDAPEFLSMLLICLLFKQGGQITLNLGEIEAIHRDFPSMRFHLTQYGGAAKDENIMLTLRSKEATINELKQQGLM